MTLKVYWVVSSEGTYRVVSSEGTLLKLHHCDRRTKNLRCTCKSDS